MSEHQDADIEATGLHRCPGCGLELDADDPHTLCGDCMTGRDAGPAEFVQIFAEGSFTAGTLTWGWQCSACHEEETGYGSATTAGEGRDNHEALCRGYRNTPVATKGSDHA